MVDLNGHEAGNGGHSQGTPTAYRDSSTRREWVFRELRPIPPTTYIDVTEQFLCTWYWQVNAGRL
jgi:hypothetical protein